MSAVGPHPRDATLLTKLTETETETETANWEAAPCNLASTHSSAAAP